MCCPCSEIISEERGDHIGACGRCMAASGAWYHRSSIGERAIAAEAKSCGLAVRTQAKPPVGNTTADDTSRTDVTVVGLITLPDPQLDLDVHTDFTIVEESAKSYLRAGSARRRGHATAHRAHTKTTHYRPLYLPHTFIPAAMSKYGYMDPDFSDLLNRLAQYYVNCSPAVDAATPDEVDNAVRAQREGMRGRIAIAVLSATITSYGIAAQQVTQPAVKKPGKRHRGPSGDQLAGLVTKGKRMKPH
jgi:hypothetical protein